jgi:DnaJ family protein A protein 1
VICNKCEGQGGKKKAAECSPNSQDTGMQIKIHQIGPGIVSFPNSLSVHGVPKPWGID